MIVVARQKHSTTVLPMPYRHVNELQGTDLVAQKHREQRPDADCSQRVVRHLEQK